MATIECRSDEEPLCIHGHEHDWGKEIYSPERINGDFTYPGKYWCCQHCLWGHSIKYPGVSEYWKRIPLSYRINWPWEVKTE